MVLGSVRRDYSKKNRVSEVLGNIFGQVASAPKLLEIIGKLNVLDTCSNGFKLKTNDLKSHENLLPLDKVNAGFALLDAVEKLKRKDVSNTQIKNFMKDIRKFIIAMLEKIFEKSIRLFLSQSDHRI